MKKRILLIIACIISFSLITNVKADGPIGKANISYSTCISFSDTFKTISRSEGSVYYKYCYRAMCNSGTYSLDNQVPGAGTRCQNGNYDPYKNITSDGCSAYKGKCATSSGAYCTKVELVDCNRKSDGSPFEAPTVNTTTTSSVKTTSSSSASKVVKKTTRKTTTTAKRTTAATTTESTTTETTTTTSLSGNNNIKKILIEGNPLNYKPEVKEYTISAEADITTIDVKVEVEDPKSTLEIKGNNELIPNEEGKIDIIVTAENGDKREVAIIVKRYNNEDTKCKLANIYIDGYDLGFSQNTYEYTLKIPKNANSLEIETIPVNVESYIEIYGNEKLVNKSVIDIRVTASDDTVCNYKIKIKKVSNTWKIIVVIILVLIALGIGLFFLQKNLKRSKNQYQYE